MKRNNCTYYVIVIKDKPWVFCSDDVDDQKESQVVYTICEDSCKVMLERFEDFSLDQMATETLKFIEAQLEQIGINRVFQDNDFAIPADATIKIKDTDPEAPVYLLRFLNTKKAMYEHILKDLKEYAARM